MLCKHSPDYRTVTGSNNTTCASVPQGQKTAGSAALLLQRPAVYSHQADTECNCTSMLDSIHNRDQDMAFSFMLKNTHYTDDCMPKLGSLPSRIQDHSALSQPCSKHSAGTNGGQRDRLHSSSSMRSRSRPSVAVKMAGSCWSKFTCRAIRQND